MNVDETTFMFSPKVLDRANVIEFHDVDLAGYAVTAARRKQRDGFTLPAAVRSRRAAADGDPARRGDYVRLGAASYGCT